MSSSGVGRGRGWLNLSKGQNAGAGIIPSRPGSIPSPTLTNPLSPNLSVIDDNQFADTSNEFTDLINIVKQLNINDDGIKFNQKKKHILESWKESCQTGEDVERCFDIIHQACLNDADLASKFVYMMSARSFITQEIHDQNIRHLFLRKLQNNFEGCKLLQKTNPISFRNSFQMFGEFYNKSRLVNGQQLTFMVTPFMTYLEMLLESAQPEDLKLFTTQLYLNGVSIKTEAADKIIEVLNKIRHLLASEKSLIRESKLWLLLALDIATSKFALLPSEVYTFYQDQLGEAAIAAFQGAHGTLSVQTMQGSAKLDSFQSSVNVLQLSTPLESVNNQPSTVNNTQTDVNSTSFSGSGFASDTSSHGSSVNRDSNSHSGKHGRPILGSGARLNKNRSNDEANPNWRDRDQSSGWNNRQKNQGGRGDGRKNAKTGKGWEHDDRFETDYS